MLILKKYKQLLLVCLIILLLPIILPIFEIIIRIIFNLGRYLGSNMRFETCAAPNIPTIRPPITENIFVGALLKLRLVSGSLSTPPIIHVGIDAFKN